VQECRFRRLVNHEHAVTRSSLKRLLVKGEGHPPATDDSPRTGSVARAGLSREALRQAPRRSPPRDREARARLCFAADLRPLRAVLVGLFPPDCNTQPATPIAPLRRFGSRALRHFHANEEGGQMSGHTCSPGSCSCGESGFGEAEPPAKAGRVGLPPKQRATTPGRSFLEPASALTTRASTARRSFRRPSASITTQPTLRTKTACLRGSPFGRES
jgi:hypothetical protein